MLERRELGAKAWLDYDAHWLPASEADALMAELCETVPWEQRPIVVFGREILQPRLIGWGGDLPYKYSGQTLPPRPISASLRALMTRAAQIADTPFNHVLLNRYRDGQDTMGMHADNEPELGKNPTIAAVSLGAQRTFVLAPKNKRGRGFRKRIQLEHGSLLIMGGTIQHRWRHGIPRQNKVQDDRINLTFRWIRGAPGWRADD